MNRMKLLMKLLLNDEVFGWRMTGLLGKDARWFLGFSRVERDDRCLFFAKETYNSDGTVAREIGKDHGENA